MGRIIDYIFGYFKEEPRKVSHLQTLTEYAPRFTPYNDGVYGQELTRAIIDRYATACSKLKPEYYGESKRFVSRLVRTRPNSFQSWSQFIYRTATILECDCTVFIVKLLDADGVSPIGFYTPNVAAAELYDDGSEIWVDLKLKNGEDLWIEFRNIIILTKFQYERDFFGASNCIQETMRLIHAQNQAERYAIENGAKIRWIGALNGQVRPEDLKKKREEFADNNFTKDNESGIMVYDQTFQNVQQVDQRSFVIDNDEMRRIEGNLFNYFGINEKILRNEYDEDIFNAWYEGKIEPFSLQLGEALTKLCFTEREMLTNEIVFSSSRLQYSSNKTKLNTIKELVDRCVLSVEDSREMLNLPRERKDGDTYVIRGEYVNANSVETDTESFKDEESEY